MSEIFAEVEEAMKRERLETFWKNYGNVILAVILGVILSTGFYSAYSSWQKDAAMKQSDLYLDTLKQEDPVKLVEVAKGFSTGLRAMALMRAAGMYLDKGENTKAGETFLMVQKEPKAPKEFRHMAGYMLAKLAVDANPDGALAAFQGMASDPNNLVRYHAHQEAALILAHKKQDYAAARRHLASIIAEKNIPPEMYAKANGLDVIYALREAEQKKQ